MRAYIADRFKASRTLISQIFSTWVRTTAKVLSSMIKVWDLDTVNTLKPKKIESQKLHSIADATEIFIQRPKDHLLQRLTLSNYKHHNNLKVLVVIAPSSNIMFISLAYPCSILDKQITKQSGYLDMMEPYIELMVDKDLLTSEMSVLLREFMLWSSRKTRIESDAALRSYKIK